MMCLHVFLLGSNFFETVWASWTFWKSISFVRLGKLSFIIFSSKFSISCCSSSPSGTAMILLWFGCWNIQSCLGDLKLSSASPLFFFFLYLVSSFFLLFQIVDLSPGFLPFTVDSLYIFFYFILYSLLFFLHFAAQLNHFCEHPDYQCFELCTW